MGCDQRWQFVASLLLVASATACYATHRGSDTSPPDADAGDARPPDTTPRDSRVPPMPDADPMDAGPGPVDAMPPPPPSTPVAFALSGVSAFLLFDDGRFHSSADTSEGEFGRWGQLGAPRAAPPPFGFAAYEGPFRFEQLTAALFATCGVTADRSLHCWGENGEGILGIGSSDTFRTELEPVRARVEGVSVVEGGLAHACLLDVEGLLYCWGSNDHGELGSGLAIIASRPTPTVVEPDTRWRALHTSHQHVCAIRDDGALYCWGSGNRGQLGNGSTASQWAPTRVGTATDWTAVSAGVAHTCGLRGLGPESRMYCWGRGIAGGDALEPVLIEGTGWTAVSAGEFHTCALKDEDGISRAYCFGSGSFGQLGVEGVRRSDVPLRIDSPSGWTTIVASYGYTCGIAGGRAYCWGSAEMLPILESTITTVPTEVHLD